MFRTFVPIAFLIATTGVASAEVINFYGGMCITAVTPGCTSVGINVGQCSFVRYRPPNIGTNGPTTKFSEFSTASAGNYTLQSGSLVGTVFQNVDVTRVGQSVNTYTATMRINFQQPATVTATTNYLNLRGDVTDWDDPDTDCDISFRATVTQQPRR